MRWWRPLALTGLIICSCSSQPLLSKEADDLMEYLKARHMMATEPQKSCDIFFNLSQKKPFVLADASYVRSLQICDPQKTSLDWDRPVPTWLEKEKQLIFYQTLKSSLQKGLFIQKNPQYFPSAERVATYQKALASSEITPDETKTLRDSLNALAPRFMADPQDKDLFKITRDYKSVRDFAKTRDLLNRIIKGKTFTFEDKFQAQKELFLTAKLQKGSATTAYVKAAKAWAEFIKPQDLLAKNKVPLYYEAQNNYVRVVWTERGTPEARKLLDKLEKILRGKQSLYEIYWLRGRMLEEQKDFDGAVTELEKAVKEPIAQWRDKEKILWSLAWAYFKSSKFPDAERHLSALVESKETSAYARFKYLYWLGETYQRQKQEDKAKEAWERISQEDVFGYYNLLARFQLDQPLQSYQVKEYTPQKVFEGLDEKIFLALHKVEETDLALRLIASAVDLDPKKSSADRIASVFYHYAQIGNYKYIFQIFNSLEYEKQRDIFLKIPRILFPEPYADLISRSAQTAQIEPELVYSIMRQESSFDPKARSPMDAFGLMQILPEVARRVAKENGIPFAGFDDLYDENKNVPIGSFLLKKQMNSFRNRFPLYVASYNASSSAVRQWRSRYAGDDLVFIENIPYEETKAYVKLVLRNFVIYKKLRFGEAYKKFPREMLDLRDEEPVIPGATQVNEAAATSETKPSRSSGDGPSVAKPISNPVAPQPATESADRPLPVAPVTPAASESAVPTAAPKNPVPTAPPAKQ